MAAYVPSAVGFGMRYEMWVAGGVMFKLFGAVTLLRGGLHFGIRAANLGIRALGILASALPFLSSQTSATAIKRALYE